MKWHIIATISGDKKINATDGKEAAAKVRRYLELSIHGLDLNMSNGLEVGAIQVEPVEELPKEREGQ